MREAVVRYSEMERADAGEEKSGFRGDGEKEVGLPDCKCRIRVEVGEGFVVLDWDVRKDLTWWV